MVAGLAKYQTDRDLFLILIKTYFQYSVASKYTCLAWITFLYYIFYMIYIREVKPCGSYDMILREWGMGTGGWGQVMGWGGGVTLPN